MPKMKTCKSASKRFTIKKNRIKRKAAFRSHILTKKSSRRQRRLKEAKYVHSANEKSIKRMLALR